MQRIETTCMELNPSLHTIGSGPLIYILTVSLQNIAVVHPDYRVYFKNPWIYINDLL